MNKRINRHMLSFVLLALGPLAGASQIPATSGQAADPKPVEVPLGQSSPVPTGPGSRPKVLRQVLPSCWPEATEVQNTGTVKLRALISADGNVKQVQAESGHPVLAAAAIEAIQKWKFEPELSDGKPVEVEILIDFDFVGPHSVTSPQYPWTTLTDDEAKQRGLTSARLIHRVRPKYPFKAKWKHVSGTVSLHATISKDGTPTDLKVCSGDPLLVVAAVDAVRKWRYSPALVKGEPVESEAYVDVTFQFDRP